MPFPLSPEQLALAEASLRIRFPDTYRQRMLNANGGEIEIDDEAWWLHPIRDGSDRKRITRTLNNVESETREARKWPGFPVGAFSITADGSGNHLVLLPVVDDPDRLGESLYRWDHETRQMEVVEQGLEALL